jgi:hypothetical protein
MTENKRKCPVCEKYFFPNADEYDMCQICGWFDDPIQYRDHDYSGGCNDLSVNEYRDKWNKGEIPEPLI